MATLTIRNLPDHVRDRLRIRAAENGRSMEAEARALLAEAAAASDTRAGRSSVEERVARLQAAFAPFRSPTGSVVDELIAERRLEASQETLESLRSIGESGPLDVETAMEQARRARRTRE